MCLDAERAAAEPERRSSGVAAGSIGARLQHDHEGGRAEKGGAAEEVTRDAAR